MEMGLPSLPMFWIYHCSYIKVSVTEAAGQIANRHHSPFNVTGKDGVQIENAAMDGLVGNLSHDNGHNHYPYASGGHESSTASP